MRSFSNDDEIDEFAQKIASFVKEKRQEKKWSRFMLCKKSGCSFLTVKSIEENEVKDYKVMTIGKLLSALESSMGEFYNWTSKSSDDEDEDKSQKRR